MRIFDLLFASHAVCAACGRKLRREKFPVIAGSAGICGGCFGNLKFTKRGSSFDAPEPLLYLLSPLEYEGPIEKLLRDFKFSADFKNGEIINIITAEFALYYPHLKEFDKIIPVPLSAERMNERGFNQSEIIARGLAASLSVPLDTDSLSRTRHTARQSSLSAADRVENVKGAFSAAGDMRGMRIILVDDIFTTGSTLKSCADALDKAGAAEIIGFTAAARMRIEKPLLYR